MRKNFMRRSSAVMIVLALGLTACASGADTDATTPPEDDESGGIVTVYTGRHYGIEPVFDAFTEVTGIEVRFTTGSDPELRERLRAEGVNTPADVVMTADAANAALAAEAGLFAQLDSEVLETVIPAELRAADNTWFALSRRMRVIQYSTERVVNPPTTYAEVGDPEYAGRLCLRPSTHPYTQSLVAGMILNEGAEETARIVSSWVANDPVYINSDTDMLRAIANGDCDVALANSYYLGRLMMTEDPDFPVAISWPDQATFGAHVNISAAAVTAHAPNAANAQLLIEWLATEGQKLFSDANFEYPAAIDVEPADVLVGFGTFVADDAAVRELGGLNGAAVDLLAEVGYQ